jgi:hypothetical protein
VSVIRHDDRVCDWVRRNLCCDDQVGLILSVLSIAKPDTLVAKRANQRMAVRPPIAVVNIWERPGHPQTPSDEQKAGTYPRNYHECQHPHETLPWDEGITFDPGIFSMRLPQNSSAFSGGGLEPERTRINDQHSFAHNPARCRRWAVESDG